MFSKDLRINRRLALRHPASAERCSLALKNNNHIRFKMINIKSLKKLKTNLLLLFMALCLSIFKPLAMPVVLDPKLIGTSVPTFTCGLWPQTKATPLFKRGGRLLPILSSSRTGIIKFIRTIQITLDHNYPNFKDGALSYIHYVSQTDRYILMSISTWVTLKIYCITGDITKIT
jgi:hypothetical protein